MVEPRTGSDAQSEPFYVDPSFVEFWTKVGALVALALPVAGTLVRAVGLAIDPDLRSAVFLAPSLSLADLTWLGASSLLQPFAVLTTVALVALSALAPMSRYAAETRRLEQLEKRVDEALLRSAHVLVQASPARASLESAQVRLEALQQELADLGSRPESPWKDRDLTRYVRVGPVAFSSRRTLVEVVAAALGCVAGAALLPSFPAGTVRMATLLAGGVFVIWRIANGNVRLRDLWPGVAVVLIGAILASGMTYRGPVGRYKWAPDAGITSGTYMSLGTSGDLLYVASCERPLLGVIGVRSSEVASIEYAPKTPPPPGPNFIQVVSGQDVRIGGALGCP